jgi:hypothetical protein
LKEVQDYKNYWNTYLSYLVNMLQKQTGKSDFDLKILYDNDKMKAIAEAKKYSPQVLGIANVLNNY